MVVLVLLGIVRYCTDGCANTFTSVLARVAGVVAAVRNRDSPFGVFFNVFIAGETPSVRHCVDLFTDSEGAC